MARLSLPYLLLSYMLCIVSAFDRPISEYKQLTGAPVSTTRLPPSKDPWYKAPQGFESAAPGHVFKARKLPELAKLVANCSAAYNLLYRTTDSNYKPSWAVTTVFVPNTTTSNKGGYSTGSAVNASLLSYQLPYDSANVDTSPSWAFYGIVDKAITTALGRGWFVTSPDYEGPLASFTAGVQSGHATIDSIRAILNSGGFLGLDEDTTKYALWGYSGGALASEWAAELQVQYAPELSFAGYALGGLTPNISSVIETVNKTPYVGLVPNGVIGITSQDPPTRQYLESRLKKTGQFNRTGFFKVQTEYFVDSIVGFAGQDIYQYFEGDEDVLHSPVSQKLINRDGIMGYHGVPASPVFAYKAIKDDISVVADTDKLVARYCDVGANILYERNTAGVHVSESTNGIPRAFAFLTALFDGSYASKYQATGCTIKNVTIDLSKGQ